MNYYAYKGTAALGSEPCGTDGKMMFELKTDAGAIRKVEKAWPQTSYKLFSYTNFFNDKTFRQVSMKEVFDVVLRPDTTEEQALIKSIKGA